MAVSRQELRTGVRRALGPAEAFVGRLQSVLRMSSGFRPKSAGTRVNRTPPKGTAARLVHTEYAACS